mgnify:CR=1 FL=1
MSDCALPQKSIEDFHDGMLTNNETPVLKYLANFNLKTIDQAEIVEISSELLKSYKNEWLLRLRLVELLKKHDCQKLLNVHLAVLSEIAHNNPGVKHLIDDGLSFMNADIKSTWVKWMKKEIWPQRPHK